MEKAISAREFFIRRGYKVPLEYGDMVWRWFFVSFTQPAFGGFWRLWNPYFGFALGKVYRRLGGDRRRLFACLTTFGICGFGHDLFYLITKSPHRLGLEMMMVFLVFGLIVALTSPLRVQRWMRKLPPVANVVINLAFIVLGFVIGDFLWESIESNIWPW